MKLTSGFSVYFLDTSLLSNQKGVLQALTGYL